MTKRFVVAVFLMVALSSVSFGTPSQQCGLMMSDTTASSCSCCATMKSCVIRQEIPLQSTARVQATQQLMAIIAPVLQELFAAPLAPSSRAREISGAQSPPHSTVRLAVLCTFLI